MRKIVSLLLSLTLGCNAPKSRVVLSNPGEDENFYRNVATQIDLPHTAQEHSRAAQTLPPRTVRDTTEITYWPVTLQEAIKMSLEQNKVLHDLGGRLIGSPRTVASVYDPALSDSNPLTGIEGALSSFDPVFSASGSNEENDRALNNLLLGGGTRLFQQNRAPIQAQLSKRVATGGQLFFRNNTLYDQNNAPANLFPSAWDTNFEAEVRQPLLQGAGVEFNRIVGPQNTSAYAVPTGVAVARINTDISLTDFEEGVRALVSDVENAYWDLYYAYRDLDAKVATRDQALETWQAVNAQAAAGGQRGEADREAAARDQYFFYQSLVEDALAGTQRRQTQSGNGASGGTFQGNGGVFSSERRLRFMVGLPVNDGRLIRPADEPLAAAVAFDWQESLDEALLRRVELRRQKWHLKRAELGLLAARNYLLPRLDVVGLYRYRGFGNKLLGNGANGPFDNAYENLFTGNFQESQVGMQLNVPLGFRQGHAAYRNAELLVSREKAVLVDLERQVANDLAGAISEVDRAHLAVRRNYDRRLAAGQQAVLMQNKYANAPADRPVPIEFLLDAQRRRTDADVSFFRSLVEYALAIKNVHFEKGSLLDFNQVALVEGPWPQKAYADARKRAAERAVAKPINYIFARPRAVSAGAAPHGYYKPTLKLQPAESGPATEEVSPAPADTAPQESPATSQTPLVPSTEQTPLAGVPSQTLGR